MENTPYGVFSVFVDPSVPVRALSRSPPRPRFSRNAKNTQKRAHMGAFLMFFVFSDPAPSYPLNFPSNTTSTENTPYGVFSVFVDPSVPVRRLEPKPTLTPIPQKC